jgi:hypothetical protein
MVVMVVLVVVVSVAVIMVVVVVVVVVVAVMMVVVVVSPRLRGRLRLRPLALATPIVLFHCRPKRSEVRLGVRKGHDGVRKAYKHCEQLVRKCDGFNASTSSSSTRICSGPARLFTESRIFSKPCICPS